MQIFIFETKVASLFSLILLISSFHNTPYKYWIEIGDTRLVLESPVPPLTHIPFSLCKQSSHTPSRFINFKLWNFLTLCRLYFNYTWGLVLIIWDMLAHLPLLLGFRFNYSSWPSCLFWLLLFLLQLFLENLG